MRAASALLVVFGLSVAVDALTREQAKENKLCRKVKKRKNKYVAAKEKYDEKYEKSCEEEVGEQVGVKATCAECAGVVCKWAASPSTNEELYDVLQVMPKEYIGCCVDTSEVTDFGYLGFDDLGPSTNDPFCWDTAKVTTFYEMAYGATKFNGALLGWDTSKAKDLDYTFYDCEAFNQALDWDTSSMTMMSGAFRNAKKFNQPLAWDTSKVTSMMRTFSHTNDFNAPLDWDTSEVTAFRWMVRIARPRGGVTSNTPRGRRRHFAPSLTTACTPAASQFQGATSFNADLSKWDVAQGTSFEYMVRGARPRGGITSTQSARAAADTVSLAHRRVHARRVAVRRRDLVQRRPLHVVVFALLRLLLRHREG